MNENIEYYDEVFYVMALPSRQVLSRCNSLAEAKEDVADFEKRENQPAESFEIVHAVRY